MIRVDNGTIQALREGSTHKIWKFTVYDETESIDFIISNSNLVAESVTYDERLCSGDELKFGLCEGTELSFQYFGWPNIRGMRLQALVSIEKFDGTWSNDIPMGWFTCKECSRQASTGIYKASCYNKLGDEYLEEQEGEIVKSLFADMESVPLYNIVEVLTEGFMKPSEREAIPVHGENEGLSYQSPPLAYDPWYRESPINRKRYALSEWDDEHSRPYSNTYLWFHTYYATYWYTTRTGDGRNNVYSPPMRLEAMIGKMEEIERNFVTYLQEVFTGIYTSYSDGLFHYLCRELGFHHLLGVQVSGNAAGGQTSYYSTIQWEYEEQYGDPHTVDGTLEDLYKMLGFPNKTFDELNYGTILYFTVTIPWYISDSSTAQQGTITPIIYDEYNRDYEWYTDAEHTVSESEFPYLQYGEYSIYGLPTDKKPIAPFCFPDLPQSFTKEVTIEGMPDFTLRELFNAVYETACEFGVMDRVTDLFSGIQLKHEGLYPSLTLYPSNDLYPDGFSSRIEAAMYEKLWADEDNVRKFRNLIITYKGMVPDPDYPDDRTKDKEGDITIEKVVNAEEDGGTDDYIVDDNWVFKNFVWDDDDVESYADEMVRRMVNLTWFPFECWCAGLPHMETGDEIQIMIGGTGYISYILRRNLKGLQNLHDEMVNGTLDIF